MITDTRSDIRSELSPVREEVSKLRINTFEAFDLVGARLTNVENTMPSAVTAKEVAQLRKVLNFFDGRAYRPIKRDRPPFFQSR